MKSAYYCIIPKTILHHPKLKPNSKLIYAEIMATLQDDGVCTKRNIHFSKVLNISKDTASRSISELKTYGFIHVLIELEEGTEKFIKRYITPMQNFLWVNHDEDNPYPQNTIGVDNSVRGEDGLTPMQKTQTLLYNNNKINKLYTNGNKSVSILEELNEKQITYLGNIVHEFYTEKHKHFPQAVKANWKKDDCLVNDSINTLYMIIKLDDYSETIVRDVIKWATNDKFWYSNLISLRGLRNKSNNGQTKFTNIYLKYKGRK